MQPRTILQGRALPGEAAAAPRQRAAAQVTELRAGEVWSASIFRDGCLLECRSGILWVTQSGNVRDYRLAPGERWEGGIGCVVVQALTDAEFTCVMAPVTNDPIRAIIKRVLSRFCG